MSKTTKWRIQATGPDGADTSTPEILGDCYGVEYVDRETAEQWADDLRETADEYGIESGVTYHVEAVRS